MLLYRAGVQIMGSENITVSNSNFTTNSFGIETLDWPTIRCGESQDIKVTDNRFSDCSIGTQISDARTVDVSNNLFDRNRNIGVEIYKNMDGVKITDNEFLYTRGPSAGADFGITGGAVALRYVSSVNSTNVIGNNEMTGNYRGVYLYSGSDRDGSGDISILNNRIMNGTYGIVMTEDWNFLDNLYINDNNVSLNQYGIILDHPCTGRVIMPSGVNFNTSDWPPFNNEVNITVYDPTGVIGEDTLTIPICTGLPSVMALMLPSDVKECYTQNENEGIRVYVPCGALDGDNPAVTVNLTICPSGGGLCDSFIETQTVTDPWGDRISVDVTMPSNTGGFVLNGTVICDYSSHTDVSYNILKDYIRVDTSCPSTYFNIETYPHYEEIAGRRVPCFEGGSNPSVTNLELSIGLSGIPLDGCIDSVMNITPIHGTGVSIPLTTDCYRYNISLSNDYVCYNSVWDINDTVEYCTGPVSYTHLTLPTKA